MRIRSLLAPEYHSPPVPRPPPYDGAEDTVTDVHFTAIRLAGKRLGLLSWAPNSQQAAAAKSSVDLIVLGDSYADDVDMGYRCWPSLLAAARGGSCLSVARGGSCSIDALEQYDRARAFMARSHLSASESTVVIVHTGGNDMLQALKFLGPLAVLLLWVDLILLAAGLAGLRPRLTALPRWSFFGVLSRRIGASLVALLALLARHGHTRVLVSSLPVCSAMPLSRVLLSSMTGAWMWRGGTRFITRLIDEATVLLSGHLRAALSDAAATHGLDLLYLEEGRVLVEVSKAHREHNEATWFGDSMWRDMHHPRPWVHAEIAAAAGALLRADDAAATSVKAQPAPRRRLSPSRSRR